MSFFFLNVYSECLAREELKNQEMPRQEEELVILAADDNFRIR